MSSLNKAELRPIDVFPMSDRDYLHQQTIVVNLVNDSVDANADAPRWTPSKLLAAGWTRIAS
jgi:hypothetical protein